MRQPEVHQLHVAGLIDHEILGLDIAVHDALGVGLAKALTNLPGELNGSTCGECAKSIQYVPQAFALNEFHGNGGEAVGAAEIVDPAYILMRNPSSQPELILKIFHEERLIGDLRLQNFERNDLSGLAISRFENNAHTTYTNPGLYLIARGCGGACVSVICLSKWRV